MLDDIIIHFIQLDSSKALTLNSGDKNCTIIKCNKKTARKVYTITIFFFTLLKILSEPNSLELKALNN